MDYVEPVLGSHPTHPLLGLAQPCLRHWPPRMAASLACRPMQVLIVPSTRSAWSGPGPSAVPGMPVSQQVLCTCSLGCLVHLFHSLLAFGAWILGSLLL